jgi:Tol biopolymer transport system component
MGEVFRAKDARLGRDVAIKVLPASFASDLDRRARFEREAQAIAALSHPNVIAIFDTGVHEGQLYLVMELLAGQTLRERLTTAIPVRKAVGIAVQIARGLGAAHARGIIHRDVKPENIFLLDDGRVKILDFGLARQTARDEHAATTQPGATDPGTVMGTVGYMAPEQLRGQPVDARADLFAVGAVLYEMLSGVRAFQRETPADTISAILNAEPPELTASRVDIAPSLDRIVRHCLEKNAADRFQTAGDVAFALQDLSGTTTTTIAPPSEVRVRPSAWIVAAAAAIVALAGVPFAYWLGDRAATATATAGAPIASFTQATDLAGVETAPSLSPDGKTFVFVKVDGRDSAIYFQRVGARAATRLSGAPPAADSEPVFSPDGERVAFRSDRDGGGVFVMGASGESVTRLSTFGYAPSWSPDGREIVIAGAAYLSPMDVQEISRELSIVDAGTGRVRKIPVFRAQQPAWSPHGTRIAYWQLRNGGQRDIVTTAADGSEAQSGGVLVTDDPAVDWSPAWAPDGRFLYFSSTRGGTMNLWRVPIDEASGRTRGPAEPVVAPSPWCGMLSFSRDGSRFAFATLDWRSTLLRVPFDPARLEVTGPPVPLIKGTRAIRDLAISPDGRWMAFTEQGAREDLFVARTDGTEYRRLTDDLFRDRGAMWSPDGSRIAFYSDRDGTYNEWMVRPDGSGLAPFTKATGTLGIAGYPVWSPDGLRLAYGQSEWFIKPLSAEAASAAEKQTRGEGNLNFAPSSWSPDGKRIAGLARTPGEALAGIGVYSFADGRFSRVPGDLAATPWAMPLWLADSRHLMLRRPEGIAIVDADTGAGRVVVPVSGFFIGRNISLPRDNSWFSYAETATEGDVWIATLQTSRGERK